MNGDISSFFDNNGNGMIINKEQLYRSVVENSPDVITRWNRDLKLIYANPAFEAKTGVSNESLYGKNNREMGQPDDIALPWMASLTIVFETGEPVEHYNSFPTPDGTLHFYSRIVPEKNESGTVETVLAVARDITEIKKTEQLLQEEHQRLKKAQAIGHVGSSEWNVVTDTINWSDEMYRIHGVPRGEKITLDKVFSLIHPDDLQQVREKIMYCRSEARTVKITHRLVKQDGDIRTVTRILRSFADEKGKVTHLAGTVHDITEQKKSEEQFREKTESLQRILETIPDMVSVTDLSTGKFDYLNAATFKAQGFDPVVMSSKTREELLETMHPEDGPAVADYFQKLRSASDSDIHTAEYRAKDDEGQWKWFLVRGRVFQRDETGAVTHVLNVIEDITERTKVKQELAEINEKIKEDAHFIAQIMDTTPDIIYIMDLNTRQMIYASRQVAADLGYSKQEIAAMKNPVFDILYNEDIPAMNEHIKKMKTITQDDKVIEIEYRLVNSKGVVNWFLDRNAVFKRNIRRIPVEKIGITQNITAKKQQELQLLTGLEILEQAEEIAEMGCWEYDIDTANFKWSAGMYRLFNLPAYTPISPDIYLDYTPEEEHAVVKTIVDNIQRDFVSFEEIITLFPEDQEKKVVRIKAVVIKDKKKKPVRVIGVDRDMTFEVKAAAEINELNTMLESRNTALETLNSELRTFNNIASHDYKETIQTLYTNLEYIVTKDARNLSDTGKANIRRAQSAIQKMKLLTEDINAYLRLYDFGIQISRIDPNPILADILSKMSGKMEQAGANIELTELPQVYADPFLFSLLLTHLIDNALKFRKLVGPTNIKIKYSQADEMNAVHGALKDMPYTIISVSDNGLGFREEDAEKIFDLFVRLQEGSKSRGSGIGLAVCKKIMSMHNGFITAESKVAAGSIFNCYFPGDGKKDIMGSYLKPIFHLYDRHGKSTKG